MKKRHLIYVACLLVAMGACSATSKERVKITPDAWGKYNVGTILFEDKAPETKGSDIYHRIIPDAESYIKAQAREVLATLYHSPEDSIPTVNKIIRWKILKVFLPKVVVMEMLQFSIAHGILRSHLLPMIRQNCFLRLAEYSCMN